MLPNLIIVGGAKCGTTSLHYYLSLHPEIFMSRPKEVDFFIEEGNWNKGRDWYESRFEGSPKPVVGEASPLYTRYPILRSVPERMHSVVPNAKLIYLVRDPMERLISQFIDDSSKLDPSRDLRAALFPFETSPLVMPSLQCLQLEQFLPYYPLSRILVIAAQDLSQNRAATMTRVFRFLGVDETFTSRNFSLELNPRSIKRELTPVQLLVKRFLATRLSKMLLPPPGARPGVIYRLGAPTHHWLLKVSAPPVMEPVLDPEIEGRLLEAFHADAQRLRRLTGLKLGGWCV
jgi:hypothetical protein